MTLAERIRACFLGDDTHNLEELLKEVDLMDSTYPDAMRVALERERLRKQLNECLACKADLEKDLLCRVKQS